MKTDRELLELAARAAGIRVNAARQAERDAVADEFLGLRTYTQTNWNPLTDDGDALRLAVKLQMSLHLPVWDIHAESDAGIFQVLCDGDALAATRRAIVRAAAAIGEVKK